MNYNLIFSNITFSSATFLLNKFRSLDGKSMCALFCTKEFKLIYFQDVYLELPASAIQWDGGEDSDMNILNYKSFSVVFWIIATMNDQTSFESEI